MIIKKFLFRAPKGGDDDLSGGLAALQSRDGAGTAEATLDDPNADRGDEFVPTGDDKGSDRGNKAPSGSEKPGEVVEDIYEKAERLSKVAAKKIAEKPGDEPTEEEIAAAAAELEAEELAAKAKAEGKPDGRSAPKIPLDRHEKILEKVRLERDQLAEQLKQFQGGQAVAKTTVQLNDLDQEILKLEGAFAKLTTDGEHEKAAITMGQIRILERQSLTLQHQAATAVQIAQATEAARYDTALERIEAAFPVLNPEHEDFDITKLRAVAKLSAGYQKMGDTPSAALQEAVKLLVGDPNKATQTAKQTDALEVTPRVDPMEVAAAARKAKAVEKALAARDKQAPDANKVGLNSDKAGGNISIENIMKMNDADFSKLPEDVLSRMRGDAL